MDRFQFHLTYVDFDLVVNPEIQSCKQSVVFHQTKLLDDKDLWKKTCLLSYLLILQETEIQVVKQKGS